jgi:hypothetical protein
MIIIKQTNSMFQISSVQIPTLMVIKKEYRDEII